jgi:outer membrane lipoprotein carrier protein
MAPAARGGVIEDIQKRQKGISTVRAAFKQEKHTELLARPIRSDGMFYFKAPVGVRWEYRDAMTVVYDGTTLYLHYLELEEAEKIDGVSGYVGPLSFDMEVLLREYRVETEDVPEGVLLNLTPRKKVPFASMSMLFPEGAPFPSEVRIVEEMGDRTVILFSDVETNVKLPDGLFRFAPPPGVMLRERKLP